MSCLQPGRSGLRKPRAPPGKARVPTTWLPPSFSNSTPRRKQKVREHANRNGTSPFGETVAHSQTEDRPGRMSKGAATALSKAWPVVQKKSAEENAGSDPDPWMGKKDHGDIPGDGNGSVSSHAVSKTTTPPNVTTGLAGCNGGSEIFSKFFQALGPSLEVGPVPYPAGGRK